VRYIQFDESYFHVSLRRSRRSRNRRRNRNRRSRWRRRSWRRWWRRSRWLWGKWPPDELCQHSSIVLHELCTSLHKRVRRAGWRRRRNRKRRSRWRRRMRRDGIFITAIIAAGPNAVLHLIARRGRIIVYSLARE
jgi:hypothetical protein